MALLTVLGPVAVGAGKTTLPTVLLPVGFSGIDAQLVAEDATAALEFAVMVKVLAKLADLSGPGVGDPLLAASGQGRCGVSISGVPLTLGHVQVLITAASAATFTLRVTI